MPLERVQAGSRRHVPVLLPEDMILPIEESPNMEVPVLSQGRLWRGSQEPSLGSETADQVRKSCPYKGAPNDSVVFAFSTFFPLQF